MEILSFDQTPKHFRTSSICAQPKFNARDHRENAKKTAIPFLTLEGQKRDDLRYRQ